MASHLSNRHTTSAANTAKSLVDLQRERATERPKTNNRRTSPYKEPVRLRNACDLCHQLKRKCSGEMPCENCSLSNSSDLCLYRPANRLGRPRGSRNRQKTSTHSRTNSKQHQAAALERQQIAAPPTADPMSFPTEPIEHSLSGDMSWDCLLDEDLLTFVSRANTNMTTDALLPPSFNNQHMGSCPNPTKSPYSTISNPMFGTLSHEQPFHEQRLHEQPLLEWQQSPSSPGTRHPGGSPDDNGGLDSYNKKTRHRTQSLSSSCQCAQGLRTLLTSLGRRSSSASSGSQTQQMSERQPYPIDTVLSNATRALEQWTALETCHCWRPISGEEQQVENLFLLAFLSVQCVLGQLRSLTPDSDFAAAACVRVGNFDVTGQTRTTVLSMLRVAVAQEIESAVEALRCKINDPSTTNDGGSGLLAQIDAMFGDLTLDIRTLQQQGLIVERR